MSPIDNNDVQSHVPSHYVVLACSLVLTTATLAVQLTHFSGISKAAEQAIVTLRVACTVVWAWFFAAYVVNAISRQLHMIEERLRALEDARDGRTNGLDPEAIASARVIAHRLMRDR